MSSTQSHMDSFTRARLNMIESQIRAGGVTNSQVIAAMANLPRENFVPSGQGLLAYAEIDADLTSLSGSGEARYLLSPPLLARLVDAAGIHEGDLVLDIGCASGYSTAILAQLVGMGTIVGLEKDAALAEQATRMLERFDMDNTVIIVDRLDDGYPAQGPYNVIFLNGASARPPEVLAALFADQLCDGGRFVGVFDDGGDIKGQAWLFTKNSDKITRSVLFDARAPILPGFEAQPSGFRFPGISKKPLQEEISAKSDESSSPPESPKEHWPQDSEKTLEASSPKPLPSSGGLKEVGGSPEETIPNDSPFEKSAVPSAAPIQDKPRASAVAAPTAPKIKSAGSGSKEAHLLEGSSALPPVSSGVSAPGLPRAEKTSHTKSSASPTGSAPPPQSEPAHVWPPKKEMHVKKPPAKKESESDSKQPDGIETEKASEIGWPPKVAASPPEEADAEKKSPENKSGK